MMDEEDQIVFDAFQFPDYDRGRTRRGRPHARIGLDALKGILILAALSGTAILFMLSGESDEYPDAFPYLIGAFIVLFGIAVVSVLLQSHPSGVEPVRVTSGGAVIVGNRRWNASDIGEIEISKRGGRVTFRDFGGQSLGHVYRVQFGNLDDFFAVVRRKNPAIIVNEVGEPVRIRIPK